MTPDGKPGERVYGRWAGEPSGRKEALDRCVESVYPQWTRAPISYQCQRKRGHGPNGEYCKQHAKKHNGEASK